MNEEPIRRAPASVRRRPFGVRLYLAFAFAGVALITAAIVYLLVSQSGQGAANERLDDLAAGRTFRLSAEVGTRSPKNGGSALDVVNEEGYSAWVFDGKGKLISPRVARDVNLNTIDQRGEAVRKALGGDRFIQGLPGDATLVSAPVFRNGSIDGAVLAKADRPPELQEAINAVRGDRITALVIALSVAVLISFLVASAITSRIKRLAASAGRISQGFLDQPLRGTGGRDEITDLGNALETMRAALRGTFDALRAERDRLSAIFDALGEAVMVVSPEGVVRFSNSAARPLVYADGKVDANLIPWLRRASKAGSAESDGIRLGEKVYAIQAREIPAEGAVLVVVRDRTNELRREIAEREFISNAAHELRNPIAGISGAVEVLRAGAKDDPAARDHFLRRLGEDTERITRLTQSLLALARMESVSEGGTEVLDVAIVVEEAAQSLSAPDGVNFQVEVEPDLAAEGDRVLLRQVIVGLLTNAFKHTPAPGAVTLRARRGDEADVLIEVTDTGTGIAPDEIGRIFERFFRGEDAREKEGFGLGLSIAKRMVDVMSGRIGVTSTVGRGSTFWVRLPIAKPAATPVA
ncbi:sensory box histidine kinase PhoR [soil metagenome]